MSTKTQFNNLIDLKDHCFLCYRPTDDVKPKMKSDGSETNQGEGGDGGKGERKEKQNEKEEDVEESPNCCKSFLSSISRYLGIPYALVNIAIPGDDEPKLIRKRWENLIKGNVCKRCKPGIDRFRDLYHQITYLKLQMDLVAQDIEQSIYVADQKSSSQAGKKLLESKWEAEKETVNPVLNFQLLSILRNHITTKAARKNTLPYVRLRRMLSPVRTDGHPEDNVQEVDADAEEAHSTRSMASPNKRHRPSLNDDSGFSTTTSENSLSPIFAEAFDEDPSTTISTAPRNEKEHVAIRKVIRCKKCNLKIMKEKFNEHCQSYHPKPTTQSQANDPNSTANPSTVNMEYRAKKTGMICYKDGSTGKESFENSLELNHPERLPNYSSDLASVIPEVVSEEEIAHSSKTIEPTPNDESDNEAEETGDSYERIVRKPYNKRNFSCAKCPKKFHSEDELVHHSQKHRMHQCNFCNYICTTPDFTALHELQTHGDFKSGHPIPFRCPRCEEKFHNVNTYKAHFWRSHLNKSSSFKCVHCEETFEAVETFKSHVELKACQSERVKSPSPISPQINNDDDDDEHEKEAAITAEPKPGPSKMAKKDDFPCSICKLPLSSFFALKSHIISHDPNIESCSDCQRLFKDKSQLEKHRSNFHVDEPASGIKLKLILKFCNYCGEQKTFKSTRSYFKHMRKHTNPVGKKKKRQPQFDEKQCLVCKQFFRNLGSHMKAHVTQPGQEDEFRENENHENNDYAEGEPEETAQNESAMEMEVDDEPESNTEDEEELSTRNSLADRVKLKRRSSCHSTVSTESSENDCIPSQSGRKRSASTNSRSRSGTNETKTDVENDSVGEKNKVPQPTPPTTALENEEPRNESGGDDIAPHKESDNARQPLSESKVDNTSNKDDPCVPPRQSAVVVKLSIPLKKRPLPPPPPSISQILPPSTPSSIRSSVVDELEDTNSSWNAAMLADSSNLTAAKSTNIQIKLGLPIVPLGSKKPPIEQVNLSSASTNVGSFNCLTSLNAEVHNCVETINGAGTSKNTQEDDDNDKVANETTNKTDDTKPDVKVDDSYLTPKLSHRVHEFLTRLNHSSTKPSTDITVNTGLDSVDMSCANPSTNFTTNPADDKTSPPSPEVIIID